MTLSKKKRRRGETFSKAALALKRAATYSPAIRSTIGADGLNFSVRNGKRFKQISHRGQIDRKPK